MENAAETEIFNLRKKCLEAVLKYETIRRKGEKTSFADFCKSYIATYLKK